MRFLKALLTLTLRKSPTLRLGRAPNLSFRGRIRLSGALRRAEIAPVQLRLGTAAARRKCLAEPSPRVDQLASGQSGEPLADLLPISLGENVFVPAAAEGPGALTK